MWKLEFNPLCQTESTMALHYIRKSSESTQHFRLATRGSSWQPSTDPKEHPYRSKYEPICMYRVSVFLGDAYIVSDTKKLCDKETGTAEHTNQTWKENNKQTNKNNNVALNLNGSYKAHL